MEWHGVTHSDALFEPEHHGHAELHREPLRATHRNADAGSKRNADSHLQSSTVAVGDMDSQSDVELHGVADSSAVAFAHRLEQRSA